MSYTFLQEQGEESSAESFSDIPASVLSRLNLTAERFCSKDSETESFPSSQSGTTCEHSTANRGADSLTLCVEGSPAKTLAAPERVRDLKESEADCGQKWLGLSARLDPATSSWRTPQCSLFEDLDECLETWPDWGTTQGMEFFQLAPLVCHTHGKGCSVWATPMQHGNGGSFNTQKLENLGVNRHWWNPSHQEWLMNWPIGWTDMMPLETAKFQQWLSSHGKP